MDLQRDTLGDMLGFAASNCSDFLTATRSDSNYSGSFYWGGMTCCLKAQLYFCLNLN